MLLNVRTHTGSNHRERYVCAKILPRDHIRKPRKGVEAFFPRSARGGADRETGSGSRDSDIGERSKAPTAYETGSSCFRRCGLAWQAPSGRNCRSEDTPHSVFSLAISRAKAEYEIGIHRSDTPRRRECFRRSVGVTAAWFLRNADSRQDAFPFLKIRAKEKR
jgi:hypothetical protein